MGKYVDELKTPSDLAILSFEVAYGELVAMIRQRDTIKMAYLVCHPSDAFNAVQILNKFLDGIGSTANIAWSIRYADYLAYDAWFITDGFHIIFSPGA